MKTSLGWGAVPAQPQRQRPGLLVQPPVVQLQAVVVQVHAVDQLRVAHVLVLRLLELEDGQVLQHVVLDSRHVRCAHPVLCRRPHETLCRVLILDAAGVAPQLRVHVGQPHQDVAARALDPLLLVQVRDVELLARRVRQHLVVLLQNLVEAHVVQVHELLQRKVLVAQLVRLLLQLVPLIAAAVGLDLGVQAVQRRHQPPDAVLREVAHLLDLAVERLEEALLGGVPLRLRARHGQGGGARGVADHVAARLRLPHTLLDQVLELLVV
jgi:hypothetical protein